MRFFLFDTLIANKLRAGDRMAEVQDTMSKYRGGVFGDEWSAWMEENMKGKWELYLTNLFDKGRVKRHTLYSVYLILEDETDAMLYKLKYGERSQDAPRV